MSLYLDYDELTTHELWDFHTSLGDKYGSGYWDALDDAMDLIEHLPKIELIRCKDCCWYGKTLWLRIEKAPEEGFCTKFYTESSKLTFKVPADHYCGFAEKRIEEGK